MQELSKEQICTRETLRRDLSDLHAELEAAVQTFNKGQADAWDNVRTAAKAYNAKITEANTWRGKVAAEIQAYSDSHRATWHDKLVGQMYESWRRSFEEGLEAEGLRKPNSLELDGGHQDNMVVMSDVSDEIDVPFPGPVGWPERKAQPKTALGR
jgi:hypothetical protein